MATIGITGGTGMIGTALTKMLLDQKHRVIIATRTPNKKSIHPNLNYTYWDPEKKIMDPAFLTETDTIFHLAGAGVADQRWTAARKKELSESRLQSSNLLVQSLKQHPHRVKTLIAASAIGWYGQDVDQQTAFTEDAPADDSFLGQLCRLWEASIDPVLELPIRLVKIRIGIVLSTAGGALPELMNPLKFGIAAIPGTGSQIISWIHVDDLCRLFLHAMEQEQVHGVYNAVAPSPTAMKTLIIQMAQQKKGKAFVPIAVPEFLLKMILGEMSIEILKSTRVSCEKIKNEQFQFLFPSIESALQNLLPSNKK
jgi:uncharacterized protein (TIGR01777 family)